MDPFSSLLTALFSTIQSKGKEVAMGDHFRGNGGAGRDAPRENGIVPGDSVFPRSIAVDHVVDPGPGEKRGRKWFFSGGAGAPPWGGNAPAGVSSTFTEDELIVGIFKFIDRDGDGTLREEEFREWFEETDLRSLMAFREFYTPIKKLDADHSGETEADEFVKAISHFRR